MSPRYCRSVVGGVLASVAVLCWGAGGEPVPAELKPFIPAGSTLFFHDHADLNGDGREDAVLVVEFQQGEAGESGDRRLMIAIRQADGKLKVVKQNDKLVYCRACGGTLGDPLTDISVKAKGITVEHYGGSGWRWGNSITFAYSRRDDTWQLVRVEEYSFHFSNPDKIKSRTYKPPRDFGKIDIADFDPEKFLGVGPR